MGTGWGRSERHGYRLGRSERQSTDWGELRQGYRLGEK